MGIAMSDEVPLRKDFSQAFTQMASRVQRNSDESFGGAFVIVPPEGAGEVMQLLALTSTDPAAFWIMLQGQINKALEEIQSRQNHPYGRR